MPRIMHFEIPSTSPDASMAFFGDVFGWSFDEFGSEDYWLCKTGEGEPGIDGGLMLRRAEGQPVVNSILVDSVDVYCEKVVTAGGEIVVPKMPIGDMGFVSYFKDLDGNIFGLAEFNS
jgi:uncharacterized protein